jgi:hypothetical protein
MLWSVRIDPRRVAPGVELVTLPWADYNPTRGFQVSLPGTWILARPGYSLSDFGCFESAHLTIRVAAALNVAESPP